MKDPLNPEQRARFEHDLIEAWRAEYRKALASGAFNAQKYGRAGDRTIAKAAVQRVFKEVLVFADVLRAVRDY